MYLSYVFLAQGISVLAISNPGVAYTEAETKLRKTIDFSSIDAKGFRVCVTASGSESGSKGLEIYDVTGTQALCESIWSGSGSQQGLTGSLSSANIPTINSIVTVREKASNASEDLSMFHVDLHILV